MVINVLKYHCGMLSSMISILYILCLYLYVHVMIIIMLSEKNSSQLMFIVV